MKYIYQQKDWPHFIWNNQRIIVKLGEVRNLQGKLVGKMEALGFDLQSAASLETLTLEILKSTEIEGEVLNSDQVRSSIARRLGLEVAGLIPSDRDVDGVVEMVLDAIQTYKSRLSKEQLHNWHAALFPTGRSGMYKIVVGDWRDDSTGPMQVISGAMGREKVHFQAPAAEKIEEEIEQFLRWINNEKTIDSVLKAAVAHLWFLTIHPFDDGNGRIARALTDRLLCESEGLVERFYSMSAQIRLERKSYYEILEKTQKGTLDITEWMIWFLDCLHRALLASDDVVEKVLQKHHFWNKNKSIIVNARQQKVINLLLGDFKGKLTTSKYAKLTKVSVDTALRDLQDLVKKEILEKGEGGGRNTHYVLIF